METHTHVRGRARTKRRYSMHARRFSQKNGLYSGRKRQESACPLSFGKWWRGGERGHRRSRAYRVAESLCHVPLFSVGVVSWQRKRFYTCWIDEADERGMAAESRSRPNTEYCSVHANASWTLLCVTAVDTIARTERERESRCFLFSATVDQGNRTLAGGPFLFGVQD